ncbi:MAG TPA: Calx-beta domain-containing protein [Pyrinomonadaceae bacterium]
MDDVVWVEDAVPAGATAAGHLEGWNWTSSNPAPFSGTLAHTSELVAGAHQHYFFNATQTLTVNAGDTLIAHVYLDPVNPPTEVILQFNDGTWEHRAYWGQNQYEAGVDGTASRRNMGALPPTGQWVRLEVPASAVGLEGRTLNGMAFTLFNGRATWDRAGKASGTPVITISDVNVNEGNSGTTSAVFDVTLSSVSTQTVSVNYTTANSTASSPVDYTAASGTVTFAPGETSKQITIAVVGDTTGELNESFFVNLSGAVNAALADNQGIGAIFDDDAQPSEVVWVEDAVPAGATALGHLEGWNWTSFNPAPFSGTLAHTSDLVAGFHQHYFFNATQTLTVNAGDILIAHVYLDPANPPTEVLLQFNDGTWEHRAYWGQNQIEAGTDGTVSCRNMGALPPTGQWVRLEVPASAVGLEGRTLNGMAFSLFNGRAVWDRAGKLAPVIPTVSISDVSVNEGNSGTTSAVFNVTLSSASTQTVSVSYATADGTATNSSDYVAASGTLTFDPGQTSKQITIPVVGDTILEPNENFFLNLSSPVNATLADSQGVGTIVNDDAPPTISISDVSVNETKSGITQARFNVTLSGASTQTISVNYATANGTASSPGDYTAASGTLIFTPGQSTQQPITIAVTGDTVSEANETFFVNLSSPVNATLADNQGVGTILNLSYFEIPVYFHVIQDTDGTGFVAESRLDEQINVLNNAFNGPSFGANVQFFFRKAGVTRNTNRDWFQMEFLNAQQESGAEYEAKRTLRQGGANALNFYTARGGTSTPFRFGWATFAEEYASNSCRDGIVVPFTTLPGDGTPNNPFNAGDLPVHEVGHWLGLLHTFEGTTSTSCNNADDKVDDTPAHKNQFIGECPAPSTDTCDTLPGTDPIHNYMTDYSDACKSEFTRGQFERMRDQYITYRQSSTPPNCPIVTMSISDATVTEGNSGGAFANFTVTLSGPSTQPIRANFRTVDGTATGGIDYFPLSSGSATVDFAPNETSKTFSVQVIGDTTVEANETFFVNLFDPRNARLGDSQGVGTIVNDDSLPAISINDVTVIEGNSGTTPALFTVTLSSPSTQTISVNYATVNGTASSPSDYVAASGTVTFAPNQTSRSFSVQVIGDTTVEANETFFVNLSNPVNATLADSQAIGTILNDDNLSYFEIPVYFHVIRDSNGDGDIAESRLDEQINVLNNAFNGATSANVQFFFRKAGVTRDTNHDWFNMQPGSFEEMSAKRVLRQGGANALNFYTTRGGNPPAGSPYRIGWGWFPDEYAGNSCRDGVVVPFTTLPGDSTPNNPFNAGDLPVHEVGHWLGLFHTFQGSCSNLDEVDDTPAHLNQSIGQCPADSTDSCPSSPGTDPVHNFMTNYSDSCKTHFTRGQFERMRDQYLTYRQSSTPPQCPFTSVAWVEPSELTWGPPNTMTVAGYAFNGSGGVELWWRDVTETGPFSQSFNRVEWQAIPSATDHTWSNTIPSSKKWHTFEVFVRYSGYESSRFIYDGSTRYYEIVAKHSGKCMDVAGASTATGANVHQWTCVGVTNQQWQVLPVSGGYYKIVARHSGKVLDVKFGGLDNGTPVWQMDENGTAAQQWQIIDVGDGYVRIMARHSGKALDVAGVSFADGAQIHQWDYIGAANQQWLLRPVP